MTGNLKKLSIGLCLALMACGPKTVEKAALNCPQIEGAEALLSRDGLKLAVFGELHGMQEAPQFVGGMVCHDLMRNGHSVLALEISKDMRVDLDIYLAEPDEQKAMQVFLRTDIWSKGMQDGRRSIAMFDLIKTVKMYRSLGYDASITLFISEKANQKYDAEASQSLNASVHEKDMADNLLESVSGLPENGHVFALVGNVHARREQGSYYETPYELMATYFPKNVSLTFNNNYATGTAWNCRGAVGGETDCGAHLHGKYVASMFEVDGKPIDRQAIHVFNETFKGYDGYFYLGETAASPPAKTLLED